LSLPVSINSRFAITAVCHRLLLGVAEQRRCRRPGTYFPRCFSRAGARSTPCSRRPGSLRARRVDAESRPADEGTRPGRRVEVGGVADQRRGRSLGGTFRTRPLTTDYRYIWVDATYHKVRVIGRVTSQATVVAVGRSSTSDKLHSRTARAAEQRDQPAVVGIFPTPQSDIRLVGAIVLEQGQ